MIQKIKKDHCMSIVRSYKMHRAPYKASGQLSVRPCFLQICFLFTKPGLISWSQL